MHAMTGSLPGSHSWPLPVCFAGGCAIAVAPAEIDVTNASMLRDTLLALLNRGTPVVVVDMTGTRFCDAAGMHAVVRARRRADAVAARFEVVISHPAARRVFTVTGTDTLVRIHPSLGQALAARTRQVMPAAKSPAQAMAHTGLGTEAKNLDERDQLFMHAELQDHSDIELLMQLGGLPRGTAEREMICEILVTRYSGLVHSCARPYRNSPEPAEDLMQVGYVGLLNAINKFDPSYGESLGAYAVPFIRGEIKRHFRDRRWQLRVGRRAQELLLEMRVAEETLTQQLGRIPTDGELARYLGVAEDDVLQARQARQAFTASSLDAPLSAQDDPGLLLDMLGDDDPAVDHVLDMDAVHVHLDELPQREQRVVVLRFYGNLTQAEIGRRLGISQMHVSRLLDKALTHLRVKMTDLA
jgi:RNA polymerase sigma-B factor